jgi:hypothetical protein
MRAGFWGEHLKIQKYTSIVPVLQWKDFFESQEFYRTLSIRGNNFIAHCQRSNFDGFYMDILSVPRRLFFTALQ